MPNESEFSVLNNKGEIEEVNMYEVLKLQTILLKNLFEIIEKSKRGNRIAIVEVPFDEAIYEIWKDNNHFVIRNSNNKEQCTKKPANFLNWCFEKAPYITLVWARIK